MKKLLTVLALIAFTSSVFATSGLSKVTSSIDKGLNTLNQKEQQLNNKIDKAQAERAAKKAEAQKKADAQKKAVEAKKAETQAKIDAQKKAADDTKKAVENEKNFWTNILKKN